MPPRLSPEARAGELHNSILNASRDTLHGHKVLPGLILQMLHDDAWRRMTRPIDGAEFTHHDIKEWLFGEPWAGLAYRNWSELYTVLELSTDGAEAIRALVEHGGPVNGKAADVQPAAPAIHAGPGRGNKTDSNTTCLGRGADYITSRLKRDQPDLAERVIKGELSANAAAIQAGFRKPTWTAPQNVSDLAQALKRRYTTDELQRLIDALTDPTQLRNAS